MATTLTLVPTVVYVTGRVYDGSGNIMCNLCGAFHADAPRAHWCRAMSRAIPYRDGFIVASPPEPDVKET